MGSQALSSDTVTTTQMTAAIASAVAGLGGYASLLPTEMVTPFDPLVSDTAGTALATNTMKACRVICRQSGHLHDMTAWITASSGNLIFMIFDTGDAAPPNRTLLWNSGSIACGPINAWQPSLDPNLTVAAGQHLDFAVMADNATAAILRRNGPSAGGFGQLPTNYWPVPGGAFPKRGWSRTETTFAAPASILAANAVASATSPLIMARVT